MVYKFILNNYSKNRFLYGILFMGLMAFFLPFVFSKYNAIGKGIIFFLVFLLPFLFLIVFPKYFAKMILEIIIEEGQITLNSLKPYYLSKLQQSQIILLSEIKSYKYESSRNFKTLKITLRSGTKIKLNQWFVDDKDDFDKLVRHLAKLIKNYNGKKTTLNLITTESSSMENRTFLLILAILISIIIVGAVLLIIINGIHDFAGGLIIILGVFGGLIWAISQIVKVLKKSG